MSIPKFSIIVPIFNIAYYNGEDLFIKCMESILTQTYTDFEVILVDDGSTDNAPAQCDAFAQADPRVVVIHKENGGPGVARNVGVRQSTGDFIFFVDADDEIDRQSCEIFAEKISKYPEIDIITSDAKVIHKEKLEYWRFIPISEEVSVSGSEFIKRQIRCNSFYTATWRQVLKRNYLLENALFFREDLIGGEDAKWSARLFLPAKSVLVTDFIHYIYNFNLGDASLSNPKDHSKLSLDIMSFCYDLDEQFASIEDTELRYLLKKWLIESWLLAFEQGKFYKSKYKHLIRKDFLTGGHCSVKICIRVCLFLFNPFLYFTIYNWYCKTITYIKNSQL